MLRHQWQQEARRILQEKALEVLKEELASLRREEKRYNYAGVDLLYLKNVVIKGYETRSHESVLPVLAMMLQFSPEELKLCARAKPAAPAPAGTWPFGGMPALPKLF